MMERRELLKFFGLGATIAPVVGGIALNEPQAQLVTIPDIAIVAPRRPTVIDDLGSLQAVHDSFLTLEDCQVTVYVRNKRFGHVHRIDCSAFISSVRGPRIDVTTADDSYRRTIAGYPQISFTATGPVTMVKA